MKTREIEMYVGLDHQGLGQGGDWYTTYVEIPADTPADKIREVAEQALTEKLDAEGTSTLSVAFIGVYSIPDEEEEDVEDETVVDQPEDVG